MRYSETIVSYAQFSEDIILHALLFDIKQGFYIDVGANYPSVDSVTKLFYNKGWTGINIEPIPSLFNEIKKSRTRDINLNCAVGSSNENRIFYINKDTPGHSSFIKELAKTDSKAGQEITVSVVKLADLIKEHCPNRDIHFMKIDVEGFEQEVIKGGDWTKYRPEVICIESNHKQGDWKKLLVDNQYKLFISDGLNDYYIAEEAWWRTDGYADRSVLISHNSMRFFKYKEWKDLIKRNHNLTEINKVNEQTLIDLRSNLAKMDQVRALSLSGVSYPRRVKRSIIGLTIDWLKFKFSR